MTLPNDLRAVAGLEPLPVPTVVPPLDPDFRPPVLANLAYQAALDQSGQSVPLLLGLERLDGSLSHFETRVHPPDHPHASQALFYVERLLKFLLWQKGAWQVYVGGAPHLAGALAERYASGGVRHFDADFMSRVYDRPFTIVDCALEAVPSPSKKHRDLGRHLDGYRIGFDLGASDLKVSAVVDGEAVFSTEIEWQPVEQRDPAYHRQHIQAALDLAASKMERLDAIGGSSAGVYVENRPVIASLYRGIPAENFSQIRDMFLDVGRQMGVPLAVVNDGEVTALAGSMSLEDNRVLGIAMGSSEAAGYVTSEGCITDWLNELAFAPVDYNPQAPVDEWSGDRGVGALYFSQQCVFRLAPKAGIEIPADLTKAQQLAFVQERLEAGHAGARQIWESMGVYLGYTIAHYADFYDLKHVLILGRCTSGQGGPLMLTGAQRVLEAEFPVLADALHIQLPDEKSRRVGQAIAAASLPALQVSRP